MITLRPSRHLPPSALVVRIAARGIAPLGFDQHVAGDRSGIARPAAAMLDDDGTGVARLVHRREGDEQRMVALAPGNVLVLTHAGRALGHGDAADLGAA